MTKSGYHHGDLRAVLLAAAADQVAEAGADAVTLRGLARVAGVSHAAPAHHFGDRAGLFTALAIEGFDLLAEELAGAGTDLRDVALAYIRFALRHPGHFEVMFRRSVLHADDPELAAARERSGAALQNGIADSVGTDGAIGADGLPGPADDGGSVGTGEGVPVATDDGLLAAQLAAWSLVHGFAALWRDGALDRSALLTSDDPEELARTMLGVVHLGSSDDAGRSDAPPPAR